MFHKEIKDILQCGVYLKESNGIDNYALTYSQASRAIEQISALNIAILGGDVLEKQNHMFKHTDDSWFFDRDTTGNDQNYVSESKERAIGYISQTQYQTNPNIFFIIAAGKL